MDGAHEMAEGVVYADLRFPPRAPTAAPQWLFPSLWQWAALGLALLCTLLLAALLGLGLHRPVRSCALELRSGEQSLEHKTQQLERLQAGQCQLCPSGWLWDSGKCYYFSSTRKSWEKSREDCSSRGAQLVTIKTNSTLTFLQSKSGRETFHVGLRRENIHADWKWVDGSALNRLFQVSRSTTSYLCCGRVSEQGLSCGTCFAYSRWICEQRAFTLQWGHSSALPTLHWGNTTYICTEPP